MSVSEELARLEELHRRGAISDAEYARAKARVIDGPDVASGPLDGGGVRPMPQAAVDALNALRRSRTDRWLGGVCAGLGRLLGLAPWMCRLFFALLALCAGSGILVYVLMWILVPEEPVALLGGPGRAPTA